MATPSVWIDWISAVATGGATIVAAGALGAQVRDARRSVAVHVNAWPVQSDQGIEEIMIHNASALPVYDLQADLVFHGRVLGHVSETSVPPTTGEVPPTYAVDRLIDCHDYLWVATSTGNVAPAVDLTFRDPAGRYWRKCHTGALRRLWRKPRNAGQS